MRQCDYSYRKVRTAEMSESHGLRHHSAIIWLFLPDIVEKEKLHDLIGKFAVPFLPLHQ
jgi:hypothetical protein